MIVAALDYGVDGQIAIFFKDSDLPGKYAEVLKAYHERRGIHVPSSDDEKVEEES